MNWDIFWGLFPAVFWSFGFLQNLLLIWGCAFLLGIFLLWGLPAMSRWPEKKLHFTVFTPQEISDTKKYLYIAMGVVSIWYMFAASTLGFQQLAFFLKATFLWLSADYILASVAEYKLLSLKESWRLIFPWACKKAKKEVEK